MARMGDCCALLSAGGFTQIGRWMIDPTTGEAFIEGEIPGEPGVYAHILDGRVVYVGSARRGLRGRMRRYATSRTMRTSQRVREAVGAALAAGGRVEVWGLVPGDRLLMVEGMPVDIVIGLEEGLIRALEPDWNRRGLGKMRAGRQRP